ncbi:MAG TPA: hypothetical protein VEF55_03430 [Candidatus Binatia bacterium]|nr:hypothetical protein [Candidatus Binatia bacterium]
MQMKHVFTLRRANATAETATVEITDAQATADRRYEDALRLLSQHYRDRTIASFSVSSVFGHVTRAHVIDYAQVEENGATE